MALIAFPRVTRSPVGIAGGPFAPETVLVPCVYGTGAKDLYFEPRREGAERFLCGQFSPVEYLPFGGEGETSVLLWRGLS